MHVKPHHPLQELLAQLLFGIETVPAKEQRRMVNRACKEVVIWHDDQSSKDKELLDNNIAVCYDCGRAYGNKHGFPDLLVQKSTWKKISPKEYGGGLLCPSCLIRRIVSVGLIDVPATFVSGPLRMVSEEQMNVIYND